MTTTLLLCAAAPAETPDVVEDASALVDEDDSYRSHRRTRSSTSAGRRGDGIAGDLRAHLIAVDDAERMRLYAQSAAAGLLLVVIPAGCVGLLLLAATFNTLTALSAIGGLVFVAVFGGIDLLVLLGSLLGGLVALAVVYWQHQQVQIWRALIQANFGLDDDEIDARINELNAALPVPQGAALVMRY